MPLTTIESTEREDEEDEDVIDEELEFGELEGEVDMLRGELDKV